MTTPDPVMGPGEYLARARACFELAADEESTTKRRDLIMEAQAAACIGLLMGQLPRSAWSLEGEE